MKKQKLRIGGKALNSIIKESVKQILSESMSAEDFQSALKTRFENDLKELFSKKVEEYCNYDQNYDVNDFEDYVDEYAYNLSDTWTNSSIEKLHSQDWNFPAHNFRPLNFVMEKEYNVHNFEELLNLEDPVDVYVKWFWSCFGTYNVCYNFSNDLNEYADEIDSDRPYDSETSDPIKINESQLNHIIKNCVVKVLRNRRRG